MRVRAPDWKVANKKILWGWKRDVHSQSRTVFFTADLVKVKEEIYAQNAFFFYKHVTTADVALQIAAAIEAGRAQIEREIGVPRLAVSPQAPGFKTVRVVIGQPADAEYNLVRRLVHRRPRTQWVERGSPQPGRFDQIARLWPMDLYAGSGLSYEAGLPTLCDVHSWFCVDDPRGDGFAVGEADALPYWLASRPLEVFQKFCSLHVGAMNAAPTPAQLAIGRLVAEGRIRKVFTDNVDNLFAKIGVPFERTRGSGVFNERHPATFESKVLLVVGVAADRRQLIRQARGRGLTVLVVDPAGQVSHGVQHLNYLRKEDQFFRMTAHEFFSSVT